METRWSHRRARLQVRRAIVVLLVVVLSCARRDVQQVMASELDAIAVPPNVQQEGADGFVTKAGALRERVFRYTGSFDVIVAFYNAEIPRHGWTPAPRRTSPTAPRFCKDDLTLGVSTVQGASATQFLLLITTNAGDAEPACP